MICLLTGEFLNTNDAKWRRYSCPLKSIHDECLDSESLQKRSASLETSPMIGLRLGSKTAQLAAKSFWNMDMFKDSLQKIAEYAAIESSSLGSSIESLSDENEEGFHNSSTEEEFTLSPIAPHLIDLPLSLTPQSAPSTPTQSPQLPLKRSKSACVERRTSSEKRRVISRKISPAAYTPDKAAAVRFQLAGSDLSLQNASQRNGSTSTDDGYYER